MPSCDIPRQQQRDQNRQRASVRNQTSGYFRLKDALLDQILQQLVPGLRHKFQIRDSGEDGQGDRIEQQGQDADRKVNLYLWH